MKVEEVELGELCVKIGSGATPRGGHKSYKPSGISLVRSMNVRLGRFKRDKLAFIDESQAAKLSNVALESNDVLLNITGASVARCCTLENLILPARVNQHVCILRPEPSKLYHQYLMRFITAELTQRKLLRIAAAGATREAINKSEILKFKIPLPPLDEQKRIAAILDAADELRTKRRDAIEQLDELLQATFLDLFGDPVSNPKGWGNDSLANFGTFKNGLNYRKFEKGIDLKCLGVGNFKSLSRLDDVIKLPTLSLDSMPSKEYLLKEGDIVFVRSNGNKALVGRCLSIHPHNTPVTFSGFCIRYRIESSEWLPTYLTHLFRTASLRTAMLQVGQGANIQNINQKILSSLPIPLPPLPLQQKFSNIVSSIEKQKARHRAQLTELDTLFASLQSRAFKGEL